MRTRYPNLTLFVVSREMNRKWVPFGIVWCAIPVGGRVGRVEEREAKSRVRVTANPDYRPGIILLHKGSAKFRVPIWNLVFKN